MQSQFHLKGLNGLRAIAALAVVVSHMLVLGASLFGFQENKRGLDLGGFGVSIFFSLSGFLITYLLLKEKEKFKTINIKAFYIRRILRIWPLYYFYLAISVITILVLNLDHLPGSLWYYIFLCANVPFIIGTELPLVGHYWSLGVEEQFYLFWPWVIKRSKNLLRFLLIFIGTIVVLKLGCRILYAKTGLLWPYNVIHVTRFECMAIGALGAVLYFQQHPLFRRLVFHPATQVIAWLAIGLMMLNLFHVASIIDNDIVAGITVILIMNVAMNEKTFIGLDHRLFNFLGKISYGIYIYHPLVIFFLHQWIGDQFPGLSLPARYLVAFSMVLAGTVLIAWASYEFFEKKFLRVKEKFALVPSSS